MAGSFHTEWRLNSILHIGIFYNAVNGFHCLPDHTISVYELVSGVFSGLGTFVAGNTLKTRYFMLFVLLNYRRARPGSK
jgi:hypothetical protein